MSEVKLTQKGFRKIAIRTLEVLDDMSSEYKTGTPYYWLSTFTHVYQELLKLHVELFLEGEKE